MGNFSEKLLDKSGKKRTIDETKSADGETALLHRSIKRTKTVENASTGRPPQVQLEKVKKQLLKDRKKLPVYSWAPDICTALREHSNVLILVAETGSGKSTQVPQFLLQTEKDHWMKRADATVTDENGETKAIKVGGMIGITEPRRVAAISLANRVAAENGSHLGSTDNMGPYDKIGYAVRFESRMPKQAKIKFMTEGMLLQELLKDKALTRYSCIIIDEVHERSTDVDLIMGFLKEMLDNNFKGRGGVPLKIIIMSATANVSKLHKFWSRPLGSALRDSPLTITAEAAAENSDEDEKKLSRKPRSASTSSSKSDKSDNSEWSGFSDTTYEAPLQPIPARALRAAESYDVTPISDRQFAVVNEYSLEKSEQNMRLLNGKDNVVVLHIEGRQHHVDVKYSTKPVDDVIEASFKTVFVVHTQEPMPGDILVFLTGQDEIKALKERIEFQANLMPKDMPKMEVIPLFGQLTIEEQQRAFARPQTKNTRKVILATNIAETSITVPGVRYVVDTGRAKVKEYRPHLGLASLLAKPISKSSAMQRMGRAGREAAGKVWRLYTQEQFRLLPDQDRPEILRADVVEAVLKMKARGIEDIFSFPLMDAPSRDILIGALSHLLSIGALDKNGKINAIGKQMATFPLAPNYARVLVAAVEPENDVLLEAIDAIAVLSGDDIFKQWQSEEEREAAEESRKDLTRREGDILTQLTAMQRYVAEGQNRVKWCKKHLINDKNMKTAFDVRAQIRRACFDQGMLTKAQLALANSSEEFVPMEPDRAETLMKCFLAAFVDKTAFLDRDGQYKTVVGRHKVTIHPASTLFAKKKEAIMFLEHVYTNKNFAKKVSGMQMDWVVAEMSKERL